MGICAYKIYASSVPLLSSSLKCLLLEAGAYETHHLGKRPLAAHLLGTMSLLQIAGFDQIVCIGGLLHSIYGTNRFRSKSLSSVCDRSKVSSCAGAEAERLAFLFSVVNRPHSFRKLHLQDDSDVCCTFVYPSSLSLSSSLVALSLRNDVDFRVLEAYKLPNRRANIFSASELFILVDEHTMMNLVAIEAANLLDQGAYYLSTVEDPNVYDFDHPLPLAVRQMRSAAEKNQFLLPPIHKPQTKS